MVIALDRDVPATASAAAAGAPTTFAELRPAYCLLGAPLAAVIAGVALAIAAADGPSAVEVVRRFSSSCGLLRASSSACVAG